MSNDSEELMIDPEKILKIVRRYWWLFTVMIVLAILITFAYTLFFVQKQYTAEGQLIVMYQTDESMSYSDVQMSQTLADTYIEIIKSKLVSDDVIAKLNLDITNDEYNDMITVETLNSTEVINISVENEDPKLAYRMVNTIMSVFIDKSTSIMNVDNVFQLSEASLPTSPSSPSYVVSCFLGLLIGLLFCLGFTVYILIYDDMVLSNNEIEEICGVPILGEIPKFLARPEDMNDD